MNKSRAPRFVVAGYLTAILVSLAFATAVLADVAIDTAFISALEGGQQLKGYVPNPEKSNSGVTIATGVDLGAMSEADLTGLGLSDGLTATLKPYVGKRKKAATDYLAAHPLAIAKADADALDTAVKKKATAALVAKYDKAVGPSGTKFAALPK